MVELLLAFDASVDLACDDIDAMTGCGHRLGDLFHVDQLAAEIGMLGEMGVRGIEVALRVEKNNVHGVVRRDGGQAAAAAL